MPLSDKPGVVRILWWEISAVVVLVLLIDARLLLMVVEKPNNPA